MADKVVAIDSTWEDCTRAATNYRRANVHPYLERRGLPVRELSDERATADDAVDAVSSDGIVYITGVSHGYSDTFTGDQDRPVFSMGDGADVFAGKIVHFLACSTAAALGRSLVVSGGAAAFFGYAGPFSWPDESHGDVFFGCDAEIDRALADGETAAGAYRRAIAKFDAAIAALRSRRDAASLYAAAVLEANRDLLRAPCRGAEYGSQTVRLRDG